MTTPVPKRKRPRFPEYFDLVFEDPAGEFHEDDDQKQEYAETAARVTSASPPTNQRYTRERWEKYHSKRKRVAPQDLTKDQLLDYADWGR